MRAKSWMPMYWGDYLADTAHLSAAEHGAYLLLIAHYWTHGGLPEDDAVIARITRMTARQWLQSKDLLRSLFGDHWRHKRIDEEIAKSLEKSRVNSANAQRRHSERNATAQRSDTQPQPQPHKKDIEGNSRRKKPETRIPDDWVPKVASVEKAKSLGFTAAQIGREGEKFKNHARQKDRRAVLWDAAFDNWMLNAADYQNKTPHEAPGQSTGFKSLPGSPEFMAWKTYFSDANNPVMIRELNQRELECRAFSFEARWPPGFSQAAE